MLAPMYVNKTLDLRRFIIYERYVSIKVRVTNGGNPTLYSCHYNESSYKCCRPWTTNQLIQVLVN